MKLESKKINEDIEYVEISEDNSTTVIMLFKNNIHIIQYRNERELLEKYLESLANKHDLMDEIKLLQIDNEILEEEIDCLYEELDQENEEFYDVDFEECEFGEDCIICEECQKKKEKRDEI